MVKFGSIARDLINLEINTIQKTNMTAQKMPSLPHALLDIANDYLNHMVERGLDPTRYWTPSDNGRRVLAHIPKRHESDPVALWQGEKPFFDNALLRNGYKDFGHLRWLAQGLARNPSFVARLAPQDRDTEMQLLERITRNCDELRELACWLVEKSRDKAEWADYIDKNRRGVIAAIREAPPPPIDVVEATRVRKIWEVGTERVALQTVIQVDGDVITRMRADLADTEANLLYQVHLQGIKTSVESWRFLVDILTKLAGKAVSLLIAERG